MLVDNPKSAAASVKGTFIFQRKGQNQAWEDLPAEPLSALKKEEGYKLPLNSAETLTLYEELTSLYKLFSKEGIPSGAIEFVRARGAFASLADLSEAQLRTFLAANSTAGSSLISRLLSWATNARDVPQLVGLLEELGYEALTKLKSAVNLSGLKECLEEWRNNEKESSEEFWQKLLTTRSFLLEQIFSWPCTIVADKAYVGGKTVQNTGGHIVDFLLKNRLTSSAALVEIKAPTTALTGTEYRSGIPNVSRDLAGSVVQVLSYRASLAETYRTLQTSADEYEVFDPPCVVVIGHCGELTTPQKRRSFELFRRQLSGGVHVITFDELFTRVERLIDLLSKELNPPLPDPDWDTPF